jgi:hypothetical protein
MDSDEIRWTPLDSDGTFFWHGTEHCLLVLPEFFPRVLSKTHQTPSDSCIGLRWSLMESDVFKKIIALGI